MIKCTVNTLNGVANTIRNDAFKNSHVFRTFLAFKKKYFFFHEMLDFVLFNETLSSWHFLFLQGIFCDSAGIFCDSAGIFCESAGFL